MQPDTEQLLESSFELNPNNYGPEDVERLNDWAIKAHNTLKTLLAEVANLRRKQRVTEGLAGAYEAERDAALARLAESEAQNLMARQIILEHGEGVTGASLVATPIVAWAKSTPRKLRITTMDMGGEDGWRPLGYTAAGAWQAARS